MTAPKSRSKAVRKVDERLRAVFQAIEAEGLPDRLKDQVERLTTEDKKRDGRS
jgi:hypothetical protein